MLHKAEIDANDGEINYKIRDPISYVTFIEKDRTNVVAAFLLVLIYAFIRAAVEIFLLADKNPITGSLGGSENCPSAG